MFTKELCCGCTACFSICPKAGSAIVWTVDNEGFGYPKLYEEECIHCNKCIEVCFYRNTIYRPDDEYLIKPVVVVLQHKNQAILKASQSGGAFSALAEYVFSESGVVYGAVLDDNFIVRHERVTNADSLSKINGSKYVQSDLNGVFKQVKLDLKNGVKVLFSGTPCQIAGLNMYLGKTRYKHLITVDILCYGVPSPQLWKAFLEYMEAVNKGCIEKAIFRDKGFGWKSAKSSFWIGDRKISTDIFYPNLFACNHMFRPACYSCLFSNEDRISDITIGDCWSLEEINIPGVNNDEGLSVMLINTNKGADVFNIIKETVYWDDILLSSLNQPRLKSPVSLNQKERAKFWDVYWTKGFTAVVAKYNNSPFKERKIEKIKKCLKKIPFLYIMWNLLKKFYRKR